MSLYNQFNRSDLSNRVNRLYQEVQEYVQSSLYDEEKLLELFREANFLMNCNLTNAQKDTVAQMLRLLNEQ